MIFNFTSKVTCSVVDRVTWKWRERIRFVLSRSNSLVLSIGQQELGFNSAQHSHEVDPLKRQLLKVFYCLCKHV